MYDNDGNERVLLEQTEFSDEISVDFEKSFGLMIDPQNRNILWQRVYLGELGLRWLTFVDW